MDNKTMFTTEEVVLEEERMARQRFKIKFIQATFWFFFASLSISNLFLFTSMEDMIWPHWVEAMSLFPGSPILHWKLANGMFVFWSVVGIAAGFYALYTRHPPDTERWTLRAMIRLDERGGLYGDENE